jgi:hypothetical protein
MSFIPSWIAFVFWGFAIAWTLWLGYEWTRAKRQRNMKKAEITPLGFYDYVRSTRSLVKKLISDYRKVHTRVEVAMKLLSNVKQPDSLTRNKVHGQYKALGKEILAVLCISASDRRLGSLLKISSNHFEGVKNLIAGRSQVPPTHWYTEQDFLQATDTRVETDKALVELTHNLSLVKQLSNQNIQSDFTRAIQRLADVLQTLFTIAQNLDSAALALLKTRETQ